jgi:hypothetical protein
LAKPEALEFPFYGLETNWTMDFVLRRLLSCSILPMRRTGMEPLLKAFIDQEGASGCARVLNAVRGQVTRPLLVRQVLEFNTFDVTLLFPERVVLLEDVIAFWDEGSLRIDLDTFVRCLWVGAEAADCPADPA